MADLRELTWALRVTGASSAMSDIKSVNDTLDGTKSKFSGIDNSLKDIGGKIQGSGKKLKNFGRDLSKATLPLTAIGAGGIKLNTDLDTATRQVSTLTDQSLDAIKAQVKELSNAKDVMQQELAEAAYSALSAGVDQSEVWDFVESGVDLKRAGFTDMATVIDATTTVMNAYGDAAEDVTKIHDIFVKTQDLGKITVDQLGANIGRVIPTASSLGVGLDQLGASYSMLTAKGQNPMIATTNLNAMLGELGKTGSEVDKILRKQTGKSFAELTGEGTNLGEVLQVLDTHAEANNLTLKDLFSQTTAGAAALTLLSDGAEGYSSVLKEIEESDGATGINAEKMAGDAQLIEKAKTSISNALIDIGTALAPYVTTVAEGISTIATKFSELDDETKDTIVQWGLLVVAAGPLISIIGGAVGVVGSLVTGLGGVISVAGPVIGVIGSGLVGAIGAVFSPVGLLIGAIGGLIGIGVSLYKNWADIKARAEELGGGIRGYLGAAVEHVTDLFGNLKTKATEALEGIQSKWASAKNFLKNPIKGTISFISNKVGGGAKPPQHATGLNRVPYDNYTASLHEGEMILTKRTAEAYRTLGGDKDRVPIDNSKTVNRSEVTENKDTNFNPTVNVYLYGESDKNAGTTIGDEVDKRLEQFYRKMMLQRA